MYVRNMDENIHAVEYGYLSKATLSGVIANMRSRFGLK